MVFLDCLYRIAYTNRYSRISAIPLYRNANVHYPLVFIRGKKYGVEKPKRNLSIPHHIVYPISSETGQPGSPIKLKDLVDSIDTKTHYVELVSEVPYVTVKVLNLEEELERIKEAKEERKEERKAAREEHLGAVRRRHEMQQKIVQERRARMQESDRSQKLPSIPHPKVLRKAKSAGSIETKEIQMTWGVADADLEHKLEKVREELQKGHRVNLVIAPKSQQPIPPRPEMEERIQVIIDNLKDVGKEWQERTFEKRTAIIRLQKLR